jgi:hypothetical protein
MIRITLRGNDRISASPSMNAGRQQTALTRDIKSRSVSAFTRAHIKRLSRHVPLPLMKWNTAFEAKITYFQSLFAKRFEVC